jgi:REP element-mobilizing transposase RayT
MSDSCPPDDIIRIRKRKLPHWELAGATYFITFTLKRSRLSPAERNIVLEHIKSGDSRYYLLIAVIVMPDHIHLVIRPNMNCTLPRIMKGIKGASARKINMHRGGEGSIWQDESYDRTIRDEEELMKKLTYLYNNSVKKQLVEEGSEYAWFYFKEDWEKTFGDGK